MSYFDMVEGTRSTRHYKCIQQLFDILQDARLTNYGMKQKLDGPYGKPCNRVSQRNPKQQNRRKKKSMGENGIRDIFAHTYRHFEIFKNQSIRVQFVSKR